MDVTAEDFRRHYESLSDEALLEIDTDELVAVAQECHAAVVAERGLNTALAEETVGAAAPESGLEAAPVEEEELVCIVEYDYADEADLARGLLEAAEIPASVESEPGVARLMVPSSLADQALRMLAAPLSDEELAAQAEAAGLMDEEFQEEEDEA